MAIVIKKAKIKNRLYLEADYSAGDKDGTRNTTVEYTAPIHDDLRKAFKRLTAHLALITEQAKHELGKGGLTVHEAFPLSETGEMNDDRNPELLHQLDPDGDIKMRQPHWDLVADMYCSGFSIGGNGDNEGVTLIGYRTLSSEKTLNLVSPMTKWTDDYKYAGELAEAVETCRQEVYAYLFEGKHQPDAQLDLFEENVGDLEEQENVVTE